MKLHWQSVPYGRGGVECYADTPRSDIQYGCGRWLIRKLDLPRKARRTTNRNPGTAERKPFVLKFNNELIDCFATIEAAKREAETRTTEI